MTLSDQAIPTVQFRRLARLRYGDALPAEHRLCGEVPVYASGGLVGAHNSANTRGPVIVIGRKGSHGSLHWSGAPAFVIDTAYSVDRVAGGGSLRWLYYVLHAANLKSLSQDVGVPGLSRDRVHQMRIPVQDLTTQRQVADFLDHECARIDALMNEIRSLKQTQVEALQSFRERILIRCEPTVRLKYGLISCIDTAHATCPQVDEGSHLVIRTTGVRNGNLDIAGCYPTDDPSFAAWTRRRVPQPGDIVFTREAPVGEAAVIPSYGSWCLGQRSVLLVPDQRRLDSDFVVLALYGRAVQEEIALRARSTTAAHLNVNEIGELPIPMPPVDRQIKAASEFGRARSRFSGLQTETSAVSAALIEYRDALITEAVAGQLDVAKLSASEMTESLAAAREGEPPEVLA